MYNESFQFEFTSEVSMDEAAMTLDLARYSAEGLVGQARVRLDVMHHKDEAERVIILEGTGEALDAVVRVYTALLTREFGEGAFMVQKCQEGGPTERLGQAAPA